MVTDTLGDGFHAQALRTAMRADQLTTENACLRVLLTRVLPYAEELLAESLKATNWSLGGPTKSTADLQTLCETARAALAEMVTP